MSPEIERRSEPPLNGQGFGETRSGRPRPARRGEGRGEGLSPGHGVTTPSSALRAPSPRRAGRRRRTPRRDGLRPGVGDSPRRRGPRSLRHPSRAPRARARTAQSPGSGQARRVWKSRSKESTSPIPWLGSATPAAGLAESSQNDRVRARPFLPPALDLPTRGSRADRPVLPSRAGPAPGSSCHGRRRSWRGSTPRRRPRCSPRSRARPAPRACRISQGEPRPSRTTVAVRRDVA